MALRASFARAASCAEIAASRDFFASASFSSPARVAAGTKRAARARMPSSRKRRVMTECSHLAPRHRAPATGVPVDPALGLRSDTSGTLVAFEGLAGGLGTEYTDIVSG